MSQITDQELENLWRDPNFSGSFRGVEAFKILLKTDLNIEASENQIRRVLHKIPTYVLHQKRKRILERRHYDVRFYGETVQMDIGFMFKFENYTCFLLLIDIFSLKLFVQPLHSKKSEEVLLAFKKIFSQFDAKIHVLESDQGSEFFNKQFQSFVQKEKIVHKKKFGLHKGSLIHFT